MCSPQVEIPWWNLGVSEGTIQWHLAKFAFWVTSKRSRAPKQTSFIGKIWENHYLLVCLWKKHSIGKIFDKVQAAKAATLFWPGQLSSGPSRISEIFKSQAPDVGRLVEKQYHHISLGFWFVWHVSPSQSYLMNELNQNYAFYSSRIHVVSSTLMTSLRSKNVQKCAPLKAMCQTVTVLDMCLTQASHCFPSDGTSCWNPPWCEEDTSSWSLDVHLLIFSRTLLTLIGSKHL